MSIDKTVAFTNKQSALANPLVKGNFSNASNQASNPLTVADSKEVIKTDDDQYIAIDENSSQATKISKPKTFAEKLADIFLMSTKSSYEEQVRANMPKTIYEKVGGLANVWDELVSHKMSDKTSPADYLSGDDIKAFADPKNLEKTDISPEAMAVCRSLASDLPLLIKLDTNAKIGQSDGIIAQSDVAAAIIDVQHEACYNLQREPAFWSDRKMATYQDIQDIVNQSNNNQLPKGKYSAKFLNACEFFVQNPSIFADVLQSANQDSSVSNASFSQRTFSPYMKGLQNKMALANQGHGLDIFE